MICHSDVLIVGGGPIGMSLALAIRNSGRSVSLLEARTATTGDTRTLALSHATVLLLRRFGVSMDLLNATPIETIHVSQRGGFGRTVLRSAELGLPALGYVVSYAKLSQVLASALSAAGGAITSGAKVDSL